MHAINITNGQPEIIWETTSPISCSEMQVVMSHLFKNKIELAFDKILKCIEAHVQGSGWRIKRVMVSCLKWACMFAQSYQENENHPHVHHIITFALCGMHLQVYIPLVKDVMHQEFQRIHYFNMINASMLTYLVKFNEILII